MPVVTRIPFSWRGMTAARAERPRAAVGQSVMGCRLAIEGCGAIAPCLAVDRAGGGGGPASAQPSPRLRRVRHGFSGVGTGPGCPPSRLWRFGGQAGGFPKNPVVDSEAFGERNALPYRYLNGCRDQGRTIEDPRDRLL
jgi:hypothetical protein